MKGKQCLIPVLLFMFAFMAGQTRDQAVKLYQAVLVYAIECFEIIDADELLILESVDGGYILLNKEILHPTPAISNIRTGVFVSQEQIEKYSKNTRVLIVSVFRKDENIYSASATDYKGAWAGNILHFYLLYRRDVWEAEGIPLREIE